MGLRDMSSQRLRQLRGQAFLTISFILWTYGAWYLVRERDPFAGLEFPPLLNKIIVMSGNADAVRGIYRFREFNGIRNRCSVIIPFDADDADVDTHVKYVRDLEASKPRCAVVIFPTKDISKLGFMSRVVQPGPLDDSLPLAYARLRMQRSAVAPFEPIIVSRDGSVNNVFEKNQLQKLISHMALMP